MPLVQPRKLRQGEGIVWMLYGIPGVGKTPLIGENPRTLILRPPTDHTDSIQHPENVEEIVISDWSSQLEAFQYVHQGGWENHDWVWIDSLSGFQDFGLRDVLSDAVIRKPSRGVEKGGVTIPEFGADVGEYGINMTRITNMVQDFCGIAAEGKINFGITCHPEYWYNPVTEENILAPWIQGKGMIPKITGYMHVISYMQEVQRENKSPQIQLFTSASGILGKDQFHAFPDLKSGKRGIIDPKMPRIMEMFEAKRETKSEARERVRSERSRKSGPHPVGRTKRIKKPKKVKKG